MAEIPNRDITGQCEGECRDRVNEANEERQSEMKHLSTETPASYPNAPQAEKRNTPPGAYGGHV